MGLGPQNTGVGAELRLACLKPTFRSPRETNAATSRPPGYSAQRTRSRRDLQAPSQTDHLRPALRPRLRPRPEGGRSGHRPGAIQLQIRGFLPTPGAGTRCTWAAPSRAPPRAPPRTFPGASEAWRPGFCRARPQVLRHPAFPGRSGKEARTWPSPRDEFGDLRTEAAGRDELTSPGWFPGALVSPRAVRVAEGVATFAGSPASQSWSPSTQKRS